MNNLFWPTITGLLILVLAGLIMPLLRASGKDHSGPQRQNLRIARERLRELKQQLQEGVLDQVAYQLHYQELQQNLGNDLADQETLSLLSDAPQKRGLMIAALVVLIPSISLGLYFLLGDPAAMYKTQLQQAVSSIHDKIPQLRERLRQSPDDFEGWMMLGKSYEFEQQFDQASQVFASLYQRHPDDIEVLLHYADSLAMTRNGQLSGLPARLVAHALQLDPDNPEALWLAGMVRSEVGKYAEALQYWERLRTLVPADSDSQLQIADMIRDTGQRMAQPEVSIKLKLDIEPRLLATLKPDQTLFVYLQAVDGSKMPLAIVRRQVLDLPLEIQFDDRLMMREDQHLADLKTLNLVARISKTGSTQQQTGDLLTSRQLTLPVTEPISLSINQIVE